MLFELAMAPKSFIAELAIAFFKLVFLVLLVNIAYVSNDIITVQELLVANVTFVVTLSCVTLHVPTELRLRVESKIANLRNSS